MLTDRPPRDAEPQVQRDKLAEIAGGEPAGERTKPMPSGRRGARAVAVQALFESDLAGHPSAAAVERLCGEARLPSASVAFAAALVEYGDRHRAALDSRIAVAAPQFPLAQMAAVDRNILRVALAEGALHPDTPKAVLITEAVELARLLGSEGSAGFVHAVLGALLG